MKDKDYFKVDAISASELIDWITNPQLWWYKYFLGNKTEETSAMRQGSMLHKAVLEPDTFPLLYPMEGALSSEQQINMAKAVAALDYDIEFVVDSVGKQIAMDAGYVASSAEKQWAEKKKMPNFIARVKGEKIAKQMNFGDISPLNATDQNLVRKCVPSSTAHPIVQKAIKEGVIEQGIYVELAFDLDGIEHIFNCKIKPDSLIIDDEGNVDNIDLKFIRSLMFRKHEYLQYMYDIRYAFYTFVLQAYGYKNVRTYLAFTEKQAPYYTQVSEISQKEMEYSINIMLGHLKELVSFKLNPDPVKLGIGQDIEEFSPRLDKIEARFMMRESDNFVESND